MKIIRFICLQPITRHARQLPKGADFFIKKSSSRVQVDRWLAEGKIHEVTEPMKSPGTAGTGTKNKAGTATDQVAHFVRRGAVAQGAVHDVIASLDGLTAAAIKAAGVKDEAAFKRLPREEQNAFLAQARGQARAAAERSQQISLAQIVRSKTNREHFDPEKMAELVESIRTHGVMEPIIVRPHGLCDDGTDCFEIVMGERRWRAAQQAQLTTIPAIVRELDDRTALEWQLTENLQREDLRPMDEARGYQQLLAMGYKVDDLVPKLHRSKSSIYARLKLLDLPEEAKAAVEAGKLPASHAELIAKIDDPKAAAKLTRELLKPVEDWRGGPAETISFRDAKMKADEAASRLAEEKKWEEQTAKYRVEGCQVFTIAQSRKVFHYNSLAPGYVGANDKCDLDTQGRTWKALLTKIGEDGKAIVAHDAYGSGNKVRVVYPRKAVEPLLIASGLVRAKAAKISPEEQRLRNEEALKAKEARQFAADSVTVAKLATSAEAREFNADALRVIADALLRNGGEQMLQRRGLHPGDDYHKKRAALKKLLANADGKTLRGIIIETMLWDWRGLDAERCKAISAIFKVKVQASGKPSASATKSKRITPAARAKIVAAMKARWAKRKAGK